MQAYVFDFKQHFFIKLVMTLLCFSKPQPHCQHSETTLRDTVMLSLTTKENGPTKDKACTMFTEQRAIIGKNLENGLPEAVSELDLQDLSKNDPFSSLSDRD